VSGDIIRYSLGIEFASGHSQSSGKLVGGMENIISSGIEIAVFIAY
jgi:hypothetical protein